VGPARERARRDQCQQDSLDRDKVNVEESFLKNFRARNESVAL
jgi:hypothetical protein